VDGSGAPGAEIAEHPLLGLQVMVDHGQALPLLAALHENGYEYLVDVFGVDTGEDVEVVYFVRSFSRDEELRVRMHVAYGGELPSIFSVYRAVLYPERELAEMFGLVLTGHPNPKRLFTTDETPLPFLLKSTLVRTEEEVHDRG
jgi:NADH:ubiquinone oxidoreductase subunit C